MKGQWKDRCDSKRIFSSVLPCPSRSLLDPHYDPNYDTLSFNVLQRHFITLPRQPTDPKPDANTDKKVLSCFYFTRAAVTSSDVKSVRFLLDHKEADPDSKLVNSLH